MPVRAVVGLPHPVLATPAPVVDAFDDALDALVTDLLDTMRSSPGCVGLAAPQIGVSRRVAVIDLSGHTKALSNHGELVLVNPAMQGYGPVDVAREGCMSVPDFTGEVARATWLTLTWQDRAGVAFRDGFIAFEARAVQHELDHLAPIIHVAL